MAKYLITGGNKLEGEVKISGNKNSVLPCLAACLLTEGQVTLKSVPKISDVEIFLEILTILGAEVNWVDHEIKVSAKKIKTHVLPKDLLIKLRASILFVGPVLSRKGKVRFSHPGGDIIGVRTIEPHLEGFKRLGYHFKVNDLDYSGSLRNSSWENHEIFMDEASVTATENLVLTSVLGGKVVTLKNCASEPHVVDLCNLLNQMGAKIKGVGTQILEVTGVKKLQGTNFSISPDYIEMGTYAIAAAVTKGKITMEGCSLKKLEPITHHLQKFGLKFKEEQDAVTIWSDNLVSNPKLHTNIWPGFPTDMMSAAVVLATQARGVSLLHDWMYESRMFFVDKLISMGAKITIADPHRVLVSGPTKLQGRYLETPDIRAGMALVLAGLAADGQSIINRAELIERGYENVVENFSKLGANIQKID